MTTVKLHYSELLIRRAVKAFWWRTTGRLYVIAVLLVLTSFCLALGRSDRSWWTGALGTILVVAIIFAAAIYVIHFRGSLKRFRRMRIPEATLEFDEERFRASSDVGASEMAWNTLTEIWCFPDFWLLFLSRAQFFTLPAADLNGDVREFILAKAKSCGTKVA